VTLLTFGLLGYSIVTGGYGPSAGTLVIIVQIDVDPLKFKILH